MLDAVAGERPSCRHPAALARRLRAHDAALCDPEREPGPTCRSAVAVEPRFRCSVRRQSRRLAMLDPSLASDSPLPPATSASTCTAERRSMWMTAASLAARIGRASRTTKVRGSTIIRSRAHSRSLATNDRYTPRSTSPPRSSISEFRSPKSREPLCTPIRQPRPHAYAVIHPVAATAGENLARGRLLSVAEHLHRDHDLEPVFIAGPGEDLSAFASIPSPSPALPCSRRSPCFKARRCLWGTIADRRTWQPLLAFPSWSFSDPPIQSHGLRGGPRMKF